MADTEHIEIDERLLREAAALDIDARTLMETELRRAVRNRRAARLWYDEHRETIDGYNRYLEQHGPSGEEFRRYG